MIKIITKQLAIRSIGGWVALCMLLVCGQVRAQNNALNFDGANDYVSIPHNSALKPATHVTVEAWIFATDISGIRDIIRKEDGDDRILFSFQSSGTILSFGLKVGGTYSELDVTINASDYLNRWVHIAAVYNGTQKIIYRNGVVIGTQNVTGTIGTAGTAPLLLSSENGSFSFFNGSMDEFRFWNVARSQAQIQSGMTTELAGTETGLVVYHNFNEGVANGNNSGVTAVNDLATSVGGTNNGTLTNFARSGTTSNWVGGNANNALNFDHTGTPNRDFVSISHNSNLNVGSNLTLSAWVRPNGASFFDNILLKGNYGYGFAVDNTNSLGYWSDPSYSSCPRFGTIVDNVWTHVAVVVVQGVSTTFYINGVQVGQTTLSTHTTINTGGTTPLTIGRQGDFDGNYFGGDMDEVMVWNTALNATQVNTAMNIGFLGNEAGLVAYYKFNHGVANATNTGVTTLTDLAGGDNNGTLTSFTLSAGTVSNWVNGVAIASEINLQGNTTTIADGDITPSTADHTDFVATLASTPLVRTFTIQNQGLRTLNISSISNTNTADFTIGTAPTTVAIGGSATFTVTLNSATLGTKNATITINNDDPNESAYDFAITGRIISTLPTGVRGNMMSFDEVDDFINAGDINALDGASQVTFETWLYIPFGIGNWPGYAMIMSKQNAGSGSDPQRIEFTLSGSGQGDENNLLVVIGGPNATDNANYNTTTNLITYDTWHHVAMVFDGTLSGDLNRLKIYINGVQQTGLQFAGSGSVLAQTPSINSGALCIGARQGGSNYFRGNMDEARIWNTARTQAQIRDNMHLTLSGSESNLLAYYQFNEASGNAVDAIAGNNGTLTGGATRLASTVSVAKGVSNRQAISTGAANYNFTGTNCSLNFTAVGTAGEIVVNRLEGSPFGTQLAGTFSVYARYYWVINNYGTTGFSTTPTFILGPNQVSTGDASVPANLKLNKRDTNNGLGWTQINGTSATASTGSVSFGAITSFSEFGVTSNGSSPLPITLVQFNASRINTEEVQLTWTTATEINNKGFEIEMSEDGTNFQQIGFVDGKGNSTTIQQYSHTTIQPSSNYFRLKQVDMDGKFSYSPIRFVEGTASKLYFAPNPTTSEVHLKGNTKADDVLNLEVVGTDGQILWRGKGKATEVENSLNIALRNFKAGLYLFRLQANGKMTIQKLIKQ